MPAEDRAYIESCFGRSLYPPERLRKAEQALCTGRTSVLPLVCLQACPARQQAPHRGKAPGRPGCTAADRNRAYYAKNRALHRSVVLRLTEQIRNCILVHQQPNARIARSGALDPERVWRAPLLNDSRVFRCAEEENQPSFTVDLLLDASASRLHCQEVIAAQGTILAQSLAACSLPCGSAASQPAGLYGSAGAQGLRGQKPAGHRPVFCIGMEPRRPCPAGGRRSGQL